MWKLLRCSTEKRHPSLRIITYGVVGLPLFLIAGVFFYMFLTNMFHMLDQNERDHMNQQVNIAAGVLKTSIANIQAIARDWSSRNTTYAIATEHDVAFYSIATGKNNANLSGSVAHLSAQTYYQPLFLDHQFNFVIIKDMDGNDIYAKFYDIINKQSMAVPTGFTRFLTPLADEMLKNYQANRRAGFMITGGKDGLLFYDNIPYYICTLPILNSARNSAPAGSFTIGHIFNKDEVSRITNTDDLNFTFLDANSPKYKSSDLNLASGEDFDFTEDTVSLYRAITDYFGKNSIIIKIEESRTLYHEGLRFIKNTSLVLAGIMLLIVIVITFLLEHYLIKPLDQLSRTVQSITSMTDTIDVSSFSGNREFYILSMAIKDMLSRLCQNRASLEQSNTSLRILEQLLNGITGYLYVTNPETDEILFINDKMRADFGLTDNVFGKKCWQVLQSGFEQRCDFCPGSALLNNPQAPIIWEELNSMTGKYYKNTDSLIEWPGGKMVHLQHSVDITDIKLTELSLKEAINTAKSASNAKSVFLSRMSHEMRTPMNAIIGMTHIARVSQDTGKKEYCLEKIDNASKHLLSIINDILDMSKIEANKLELVKQEFNLESMLINIINVVHFRAEEKRQNVIVDVDKNVPPFIVDDEIRLSQVITNLLSNAIKFTPHNGTIILRVTQVAEENDISTLRIEVIDNGIGISEENQSRLFRSFEQADGGISRKYGGTGLGLAISKRIVILMGGTIWVESRLGEGSKFIFTVKVEKGKSEPRHKIHTINKSNFRILVVDDSAEIRDYFIHIMPELGFPCEVAADGQEALEMISSSTDKPYDIIFVDWLMPGINGVELTKQIRQFGDSNAIIIMISASEWSDIEQEATKAGISKFLPKPLFPSTILNAINEVMEVTIKDVSSAQQVTHYDFSAFTVLLAEDVEINREIISSLLENTGISMNFAENGAQALHMFEQAPDKYDMILMDIHMPEMDGYEVTTKIRALPLAEAKRIPIIAMTANVFREDVLRCKQAGMNDHIGKPVDINKLLAKLYLFLHDMPEGKITTAVKEDDYVPTADASGFARFLPEIDVEDGLTRLRGNKNLYLTLLKGFEGRKMADELIQAVQQGDFAKAAYAAHTIKGVAANLGLKSLITIATTIEQQAKDLAINAELIDCLDKATDSTICSIQQLLKA